MMETLADEVDAWIYAEDALPDDQDDLNHKREVILKQTVPLLAEAIPEYGLPDEKISKRGFAVEAFSAVVTLEAIQRLAAGDPTMTNVAKLLRVLCWDDAESFRFYLASVGPKEPHTFTSRRPLFSPRHHINVETNPPGIATLYADIYTTHIHFNLDSIYIPLPSSMWASRLMMEPLKSAQIVNSLVTIGTYAPFLKTRDPKPRTPEQTQLPYPTF